MTSVGGRDHTSGKRPSRSGIGHRLVDVPVGDRSPPELDWTKFESDTMAHVLVNIHEAKTHQSRLLDRVAAGEEIVIGRAGKPIARLIAYQAPVEKRRLGVWQGEAWMAPDFDDTDEETIRAFEDDD